MIGPRARLPKRTFTVEVLRASRKSAIGAGGLNSLKPFSSRTPGAASPAGPLERAAAPAPGARDGAAGADAGVGAAGRGAGAGAATAQFLMKSGEFKRMDFWP